MLYFDSVVSAQDQLQLIRFSQQQEATCKDNAGKIGLRDLRV
jgi:hypothetical protein